MLNYKKNILVVIKIKQKCSEEELLEQLRDHYSRNTKITSKSFDKDKKVCSLNQIRAIFGTWDEALKKAKINRNDNRREEILEQLKDHYLRNPNMDSKSFKKDKTVCTPDTVRGVFGSWYEALREAKIPIKSEITKEKIIFQLKEFYKEHSYITSTAFDKDKSVCSSRTVSQYFESWEEALVAAGLQEKIIYVEYEKEKLFLLLKEKVKTGELRYKIDIEKIAEIPSWTYISKLWTWDELVKLLKLKRRVYAYTDKEIIEKYVKLRRKKKYKGKRITSKIMKLETGLSIEGIVNHFGSWNNFLELMNEKDMYEMTEVLHTDEELLEQYREFSVKIGKDGYGATAEDLGSEDFPYSAEVLLIRFKSLNKIRELLGFKVTHPRTPEYTKKQLIRTLLKKYKEYGRKLTQTELNEIRERNKREKKEKFPAVKTILNHFQTTKMSEVWEEVLKDRK